MAILERDIAMQGKDPESGRDTLDFPITRLGNIEDIANIQTEITDADYIAILKSGNIYAQKIKVSDLISSRFISMLTFNIPASNDSNRTYVLHEDALVMEGFCYLISCDSAQSTFYANAGVIAGNMTINGQMTFAIKNPTTVDLGVRIFKIGVPGGIGEVINSVGGTGSVGGGGFLSVEAVLRDIVIPVAGWTDSGIAAYPKMVEVPVADITAAHIPNITIEVGSHAAANLCGLCPTAESYDGKVRFYAKKIPTSVIAGVCMFYASSI